MSEVSISELLESVIGGDQFNYGTWDAAAKDAMVQARDRLLVAENEIAEMRAVTGSKCPRDGCEHRLKAQHGWVWLGDSAGVEAGRMCKVCDAVCFTDAKLLRDYPAIAAELGLDGEQ